MSLGQAIEDEIEEVIKAIRDKLEESYCHLNNAEHFQLDTLKERFGDYKVFRPARTFSLNNSMSLSAMGALTTYLIVLVQFKTGEQT